MKIQKAQIPSGRSVTEPLNDEEKTSMKSIRLRIQASSSTGCVADLKEASRYVDYAVSTASRGWVFRSGGVLSWDMSLDAMITCTITDASHANESEEMIVNGKLSKEPHRSQGSKVIALGTFPVRESVEYVVPP